jgi:hypothetical protein
MKRTLKLLIAVATAVVTSVAMVPASQAAKVKFDHLEPGGQPRLAERVPVNVVFLGYEAPQVPRGQYLAGLPARYEPVVRSRLNYGVTEKLGIKYTYDYNVKYSDAKYEDRFFGQLTKLAKPAPLTQFQTDYNAQTKNVLDVKDNHYIDAPSVEKWLAKNPPAGVDTRRNTVFFINWYGRSDFKFHVYTKTNEPDPDTGYNFGVLRDSRKLIAWGGTTAADEENGLGSTRRVWFHDLSAGPESWTENWNVDTPDLDGNGVEDYRMPATWEYTANGYRKPAALAGDLAKITRYVALNLLFTSSPLYPAELPTSNPPRSINIDSNTYEGWPGVDASKKYIKPGLLLSELSELRWRNTLDYDNQDLPYKGDAKRCYLDLLNDVSCYPELGYPAFANVFLQNTFQLARTKDDKGRVDYELPIFNYAIGEGVGSPALGFADDNYRDGTQSYVFAFVSPEIVKAGYGLTTTLIHEVGHHVGLSHPHDGYDSTSGVDYEPADAFLFANAGDESNSMMSYIDLNWDFSQFDQDNSNRFLTAAYNEAANRLAAAVLADPDAAKAQDELVAADKLLGQAKAAFARHEYRTALTFGDRAFKKVAEGAKEVGVPVTAVTADFTARANAARSAGTVHQGDEFIDSLEPGGPRSQP